jgi:hypothetical protein
VSAQLFTFAKWRWDVQAALHIVADGRDVEQVPVFKLAALLGVIRVDEAHIDTVDLTEPILLAPLPDSPDWVLPIDGWHRIAKAARAGLDTLPAVRLTETESAAIRTELRRPR